MPNIGLWLFNYNIQYNPKIQAFHALIKKNAIVVRCLY